jgi:hypothetical protein
MQPSLSVPMPIVFGNPRTARSANAHRAEPATEPTAAEADPGYVYLSASRTMPGFVQVGTSTEDPEGLTWSLQTVSGVTHFRNVHAVRTTNCRALAERFRQAVIFDQIPHHADLFKIPLRFARNILDVEAKPFRPLDAAPRPERGWSMALIASVAVALTLPIAMLVHPPQPPTAQAAPARPVAHAPEAPVLAKPQFRISKM